MTRARRIAAIAASALLGLVPAAGAQQASRPRRPRPCPASSWSPSRPGTPGAERGKAVKDHGGKVVTEIPALNAVAIAFEDLKAKKDKAADKAKAGELKQDKRFASSSRTSSIAPRTPPTTRASASSGPGTGSPLRRRGM